MGRTAQDYLSVWQGWIGYSEANGKHKKIIDIYNDHKPLARGYAVQYRDEWCDTTVSAAAIKAGVVDLIGTECGCEEHVKIFKRLGIWIEDGTITPKPGYIIVYNWDDNTQPNDGYSDHIGVVESVKNGVITCIEGNKGEAVGYRSIPVGWGYIRGYAAPKFDDEASSTPSAGGNADTESSSGLINKTPKWTGKVEADVLNVRTWAGTEYANVKSWPKLSKGNLVDVCDGVNAKNGDTWYFVRIDGKVYGFVHSDYIVKVGAVAAPSPNIAVGTVLQFTGNTHFTSSYKSAKGKTCKPGKAKVTAVNLDAAHPYHLKAEKGGGSDVCGWVNASDVK